MFQRLTQTSPSLAIIVPGAPDKNRGDQALAWEATRLLRDAGLCERVYIIQSQDRNPISRQGGYHLLAPLLSHPSRGKVGLDTLLIERVGTLFSLGVRACVDFLVGSVLLFLARWRGLCRWFLRGAKANTFDTFCRADFVAVKGGGLFHAYGGYRAPYATWYSLFYVRLAHALHKPVLVLPNSFGPFSGFTVKRQIASVMKRATFLSARERLSAQQLGAIIGAGVPVFADMAFTLMPANKEKALAICHASGFDPEVAPCVAFTVRPWRFTGEANPRQKYRAYLQAIATAVRHVRKRGFVPVFVTQVSGPGSHENDTLAIRHVRQLLSDCPTHWVDTDADCHTLMAVYGRMRYVIGTRFHSIIFAQAQGVPCLAVSYGGNKAPGIMMELGMTSFVVPIERVTGDELARRFDLLIASRKEVIARLEEYSARACRDRQLLIYELQKAIAAGKR